MSLLDDDMPFGFTSMPSWASLIGISDKGKVLLHFYAEFANKSQGFLLYATDERSAQFLKWGIATVRRAKAELRKAGIISVQRGKPGHAAQITLNWRAVSALAVAAAQVAGLHVNVIGATEQTDGETDSRHITGDSIDVSPTICHAITDDMSMLSPMIHKPEVLKPEVLNQSTTVATLREDVESDVPGPDYDPTQAEWESWTELKRRKWGLQFERSILDVYWEEHKRAFGVPPKFSLHGKPNSSALIGAIGHRLETAWPSQIRAVFRYAFAVRESVDRFVSDNRGNPLALLSDGVFNRISLVADEWFPDA